MTAYTTIGQLRLDVAQLTQPIPIARGRYAHRVPSLLDQLRVATQHTRAEKGPERRRIPNSASPANDDAIHRITQIETGITHWARRLSIWPTGAHHPCPTCRRPPDARWPETALRRLAGVAEHLAPTIADQLATDVHTWWGWAAAQAGWSPDDLLILR